MLSLNSHRQLMQIFQLWNRRDQIFPTWHGIGQCDNTESLICFVESEQEKIYLQKVFADVNVRIETRSMPRFSQIGPRTDLGKLDKLAAKLLPGATLSAVNDDMLSGCEGDGCSGKLAAFLRFTPCEAERRVWALGAAHVIGRVRNCRPTSISADVGTIAQKVVTISPDPLPAEPEIDIAAAQLLDSSIADPTYAPLNVAFTIPAAPQPNQRVHKLNHVDPTKLSTGIILCRCPMMNVHRCDDPTQSSTLTDLIMIGSIAGKEPFAVDESDSGSLVVSDDGHPLATISAKGKGDSASGPSALATLLISGISELEAVIRQGSNVPSDSRLEVMIEKCPGT